MELFATLIVIAVAVALASVRRRRRNRRQRLLLILCQRAGVRFSVLDPFPDTIFLPFRLFGRGDSRGWENAVWGEHDDAAVRVFDYWFEERDDRGIGAKRDLTCGVVALPFGVPPLAVVPRGWTDPSEEPVEGQSVTLELEAFNRRFDVRCPDPRAAVAFLDQRMMDTLLQIPLRIAIHVHDDRMLLVGPTLEPGEMLLLLDVARELATRVPRVVASLYPPRPAEGPYESRWLQGKWSPAPTSDGRGPADLGG